VTRLEQLGLEVAAEQLMEGQRGLGRLLARLLVAAPRTVSRERLVDAIVQRKRGHEPTSTDVIYVRISLLRDRLQDLGFSRTTIETVYGNQGYRIRRDDAERIIERLKDAA